MDLGRPVEPEEWRYVIGIFMSVSIGGAGYSAVLFEVSRPDNRSEKIS